MPSRSGTAAAASGCARPENTVSCRLAVPADTQRAGCPPLGCWSCFVGRDGQSTHWKPGETPGLLRAKHALMKNLLILTTVWLLGWVPVAQGRVTIEPVDGKLRVEVDGELFTEYCYQQYAKPILYPIIGPYGVAMTRNYPMRDDVAGEAHDHPHHKSLWFTHGDVNGVDFWAEHPDSGKTVHLAILHQADGEQVATLATKNKWVGPDGKVVCTDTRELWFRVLPKGRAIDVRVTIHASHGEVVFGDTKEGTFGLRTHPKLRLKDNPPEVTSVNGHIVNNEGDTGSDAWGKRAAWVDYFGEIEGHSLGIAILDHPSNPRHPTWWHARSYGLFAANPFGVHDFEGKPEGTGDMKIASGEKAVFLYRVLFHEGDAEAADIAGKYKEFASEVPAPIPSLK